MTRAAPTLTRLGAAVRLISWRALFAADEVLAPTRAARAAADLWFTVPARGRPGEPVPDGEEFAVHGSFGVVHGTAWGTGPAVYFMHGWGGHGAQVAPLVQPLVAAGVRVVTFDAPGHGRTAGSAAARQSNAVLFGRALGAVVELHGPPQAVVAHSLGAIAAGVALCNGWVSTERLVLVAPLTEVSTQLDTFSRLLHLGPRTRARLPAEVKLHTGMSISELTLAHLVPATSSRSVLLVHDHEDGFTPYEATADLSRRWPGATLMSTSGLGHSRLLADPVVVDRVVRTVVESADFRISR